MSTVITRYRGDTIPDQFTILQSNGSPQDLSGYAFLLTVNRTKDPLNIADQVFQVTGVISAPTSGVVEFPLTDPQADQTPGKYYYDIQATTPTGKKHTIQKGTYKFKQDITKA